MTLVDHLDELRRRLIVSIVALIVASIGGWQLVPWVFDLLIGQAGHIQYLGPADAFLTRFKLALYIGAVIASPVMIAELCLFIAPGLHKHEKRFVIPAVFSGVLLFFGGAGIAVAMLPKVLEILQKFGGGVLEANYTVDRFVSFVGGFILSFGVVFEIPVVLVLLARIGVLSYSKVAGNRKYALLTCVVLSAAITPTGDPFTLMLITVPLYMLFEISLFAMYLMERTRRKNEAAAESDEL